MFSYHILTAKGTLAWTISLELWFDWIKFPESSPRVKKNGNCKQTLWSVLFQNSMPCGAGTFKFLTKIAAFLICYKWKSCKILYLSLRFCYWGTWLCHLQQTWFYDRQEWLVWILEYDISVSLGFKMMVFSAVTII